MLFLKKTLTTALRVLPQTLSKCASNATKCQKPSFLSTVQNKSFSSLSVRVPLTISKTEAVHCNGLLNKYQKACSSLLQPSPFNIEQIRTIVIKRYRPNAYKRLKKHGYRKRISSLNGKKMLWRRKLAGKRLDIGFIN